jgi:hypothetical protein
MKTSLNIRTPIRKEFLSAFNTCLVIVKDLTSMAITKQDYAPSRELPANMKELFTKEDSIRNPVLQAIKSCKRMAFSVHLSGPYLILTVNVCKDGTKITQTGDFEIRTRDASVFVMSYPAQ